jgi:hypothetical protein
MYLTTGAALLLAEAAIWPPSSPRRQRPDRPRRSDEERPRRSFLGAIRAEMARAVEPQPVLPRLQRYPY